MTFQFYSVFLRRERHSNQKETVPTTVKKTIDPMDDDDAFEDAGSACGGTPLSMVADAFEELCRLILSKNGFYDLELRPFCEACSLVSELFGCLGIAFKFAEYEYMSKVQDLMEASEVYGTLTNVLDSDVENDTVKSPGSLSRNLRRVRQGLDLIRVLFQNFMASDESSLKEAASTAYAEACAPYHTWAVRTAVYAGMCALPSREQLIVKLSETDDSVVYEMRRYIKSSIPIIEYIDKLYMSRNISLDW